EERDTIASARHGSLGPKRTRVVRSLSGHLCQLRKRFMKKPNVKEASEDYGKLANRLKNEDNPHYSSMCFQAMAKCDRLMGDSSGEAEAWANAGRQFSGRRAAFSAQHARTGRVMMLESTALSWPLTLMRERRWCNGSHVLLELAGN
ncbi:40-kDa huntingtin-associated protein, partial [Geodia barretti]